MCWCLKGIMKYNPKIKGKEKILHAAVKTVTGYVVIGKCHADCFYTGMNLGLTMSSKSDDQGFVSNKGRYLNRKQSFKVAKKAGQLDLKTMAKSTEHLISEDIWYQRKRFIYCSMRGYVEIK